MSKRSGDEIQGLFHKIPKVHLQDESEEFCCTLSLFCSEAVHQRTKLQDFSKVTLIRLLKLLSRLIIQNENLESHLCTHIAQQCGLSLPVLLNFASALKDNILLPYMRDAMERELREANFVSISICKASEDEHVFVRYFRNGSRRIRFLCAAGDSAENVADVLMKHNLAAKVVGYCTNLNEDDDEYMLQLTDLLRRCPRKIASFNCSSCAIYKGFLDSMEYCSRNIIQVFAAEVIYSEGKTKMCLNDQHGLKNLLLWLIDKSESLLRNSASSEMAKKFKTMPIADAYLNFVSEISKYLLEKIYSNVSSCFFPVCFKYLNISKLKDTMTAYKDTIYLPSKTRHFFKQTKLDRCLFENGIFGFYETLETALQSIASEMIDEQKIMCLCIKKSLDADDVTKVKDHILKALREEEDLGNPPDIIKEVAYVNNAIDDLPLTAKTCAQLWKQIFSEHVSSNFPTISRIVKYLSSLSDSCGYDNVLNEAVEDRETLLISKFNYSGYSFLKEVEEDTNLLKNVEIEMTKAKIFAEGNLALD